MLIFPLKIKVLAVKMQVRMGLKNFLTNFLLFCEELIEL